MVVTEEQPFLSMLSGVIEDSCGSSWRCQQSQRADFFIRMKSYGVATYMYGPKDDAAKHRLYSLEEEKNLQTLIEAADAQGISFVYAISLSLDIAISSATELDFLERKVKQVSKLGCKAFAILFNNIDLPQRSTDSDVCSSSDHAEELFTFLKKTSFLFCCTEPEQSVEVSSNFEPASAECCPSSSHCTTESEPSVEVPTNLKPSNFESVATSSQEGAMPEGDSPKSRVSMDQEEFGYNQYKELDYRDQSDVRDDDIPTSDPNDITLRELDFDCGQSELDRIEGESALERDDEDSDNDNISDTSDNDNSRTLGDDDRREQKSQEDGTSYLSSQERQERGRPEKIKQGCLALRSLTIKATRLPEDTTCEQVTKHFEAYGEVDSVEIFYRLAFIVMKARSGAVAVINNKGSRRFPYSFKKVIQIGKRSGPARGTKHSKLDQLVWKSSWKDIKMLWHPGKFVEYSKFMTFWNKESGTTFIPWNCLGDTSLDALKGGGVIDPDTIPHGTEFLAEPDLSVKVPPNLKASVFGCVSFLENVSSSSQDVVVETDFQESRDGMYQEEFDENQHREIDSRDQSDIRDDAFPTDHFPVTLIDLEKSPVTLINVERSPVTLIDLESSPVTLINLERSPVTLIDLEKSPVTLIDLERSPVALIDVERSPITLIDVERSHVTLIDLERSEGDPGGEDSGTTRQHSDKRDGDANKIDRESGRKKCPPLKRKKGATFDRDREDREKWMRKEEERRRMDDDQGEQKLEEKKCSKLSSEERRERGLPEEIKPKCLALCSLIIWIGRLSKHTTEEDLHEYFSSYGEVDNIELIGIRRCAFIVMKERSGAAAAIRNLKKRRFRGVNIKMSWSPGKFVKSSEFRWFWDEDLGITFIPWDHLRDKSLDSLKYGGVIDPDTIPPITDIAIEPEPESSVEVFQNLEPARSERVPFLSQEDSMPQADCQESRDGTDKVHCVDMELTRDDQVDIVGPGFAPFNPDDFPITLRELERKENDTRERNSGKQEWGRKKRDTDSERRDNPNKELDHIDNPNKELDNRDQDDVGENRDQTDVIRELKRREMDYQERVSDQRKRDSDHRNSRDSDRRDRESQHRGRESDRKEGRLEQKPEENESSKLSSEVKREIEHSDARDRESEGMDHESDGKDKKLHHRQDRRRMDEDDWDRKHGHKPEKKKSSKLSSEERRELGLPDEILPKRLALCSLTIWVGSLPKSTTIKDLEKHFEVHGEIGNVDFIQQRGCAYIEMKERADAAAAVKHFTKYQRYFKISWAPGKYIKNSNFKSFWNLKLGTTFIPWERLRLTSLEALKEGGVIDPDTIPPATFLPVEIPDNKENEIQSQQHPPTYEAHAVPPAALYSEGMPPFISSGGVSVPPPSGFLQFPLGFIPPLGMPPPAMPTAPQDQLLYGGPHDELMFRPSHDESVFYGPSEDERFDRYPRNPRKSCRMGWYAEPRGPWGESDEFREDQFPSQEGPRFHDHDIFPPRPPLSDSRFCRTRHQFGFSHLVGLEGDVRQIPNEQQYMEPERVVPSRKRKSRWEPADEEKIQQSKERKTRWAPTNEKDICKKEDKLENEENRDRPSQGSSESRHYDKKNERESKRDHGQDCESDRDRKSDLHRNREHYSDFDRRRIRNRDRDRLIGRNRCSNDEERNSDCGNERDRGHYKGKGKSQDQGRDPDCDHSSLRDRECKKTRDSYRLPEREHDLEKEHEPDTDMATETFTSNRPDFSWSNFSNQVLQKNESSDNSRSGK